MNFHRNRFGVYAGALLLGTVAAAQGPGSAQTTLKTIMEPRSGIADGLAPPRQPSVADELANAPLGFERNVGQSDTRVRFLSRSTGYALFLTADGAVLSMQEGTSEPMAHALKGRRASEASTPQPPRSSVLRMALAGSNPRAQIAAEDELLAKSNYLLGNDPKGWHRHVPTYAKVRYQGVYPGVDLVFHGNHRQLEYDFVLSPGADPGRIRLAFDGAKNLRVDRATGDLLITTSSGSELRHVRPRVYQQDGGRRVDVDSRYKVLDDGRVGFELAAYDRTKTLTVDPTVVFTTFLAGDQVDHPQSIAVDSQGNSYITGWTDSSDYPIVGGLPKHESCTIQGGNLSCPAMSFVTKLNASGQIVFSTLIGGSGSDLANAIAVDSTGVYITGISSSNDFPTNSKYGAGGGDAFVAKIAPTGDSYVYVTTFGGTDTDVGYAIAVDASHAAYAAGKTYSNDFPTSKAFSTTLKPWQSIFGGVRDGFVVKLTPSGSLSYSTYIGGSAFDAVTGIAVDNKGHAYVTGTTGSTNFPTVGNTSVGNPGNGYNAFVAELKPDGSGAVFSMFLGGTTTGQDPAYPPDDGANAIALDAAGNIYVTGDACSPNFPVTPGAFETQPLLACNSLATFPGFNAFVTKLSNTGTLLASTFLGGDNPTDGLSVAVGPSGQVYVGGDTASLAIFLGSKMPFVPNPSAGYVARLSPSLQTLTWNTFLGAEVASVAAYQARPRFGPPSIFTPTEVYTTGYRFRPNTDVDNFNNSDGFVVKLNDPPQIAVHP